MKLVKSTLGLCLGAQLLSGATLPARADEAPLPTIERLDVPRYLGTWYEIAKLPNRFQKQCVADTSAEYRSNEDGTLSVINRCRLANGNLDEARGTARQIGPADSPKLKVRFAPVWLSFLPAVWGDYWVIDIDPAYQWVAVGEPRREYLWILARTPQLDPAVYQQLSEKLARLGFPVDRLQLSPHGRPH